MMLTPDQTAAMQEELVDLAEKHGMKAMFLSSFLCHMEIIHNKSAGLLREDLSLATEDVLRLSGLPPVAIKDSLEVAMHLSRTLFKTAGKEPLQ